MQLQCSGLLLAPHAWASSSLQLKSRNMLCMGHQGGYSTPYLHEPVQSDQPHQIKCCHAVASTPAAAAVLVPGWPGLHPRLQPQLPSPAQEQLWGPEAVERLPEQRAAAGKAPSMPPLLPPGRFLPHPCVFVRVPTGHPPHHHHCPAWPSISTSACMTACPNPTYFVGVMRGHTRVRQQPA